MFDVAEFREWLLDPPMAALEKDGLEIAFEEGAGVVEVLFGVSFGGGEALKRFVEQADDPLLFGQRGKETGITFNFALFSVIPLSFTSFSAAFTQSKKHRQ